MMAVSEAETGSESERDTERVSVPKALLERLLDRVDELEEELQEYRADNERDKAQIRQQVTEAVESESSESVDEAGARELLPMERLVKLGESGVTAEVTASVRRAKEIFTHFGQWSSKTPAGYVVKDNLKQLLETATGESLAWKQVYRACRALEKFTKGVVRFEKTRRHGWIVTAESLEQMSSVHGG
jgi:hypothetical protein